MSIEMLGLLLGSLAAIITVLLAAQWIDTIRFNKEYEGSMEDFSAMNSLISMHKMNIQGDFKISKGNY
jgi:hypothetical protein